MSEACHITRGLDGWRQCVDHGWEGHEDELRRIRVCPLATPPVTRSGGLLLRCCDDPTPALHNGQSYCQACDRTLVPATAEQEAAWLARSLIPTDAATDEADQPGPFAQADPSPVDEAER